MARSHLSCSETGREAVSKWSDAIKSSEHITSEPRETYLLKTDREDLSEDGLIRRWRFGRKVPETRNRTIILLGETGTGKSTLINMMINYMLCVKWEDKVRFEIIRDEGKKSESHTTAVTAYEIHGLESLSVPFSLTVIDTPGFGDTDGPEKPKITAQNLHNLFSFSSDIKLIDAVCLVMKASQNRLSSSQKYIFDTILSLFEKNLEKNILTLITFSDWTPASAVEAVTESGVPLFKDVNNEPVHFLFNNLPPQRFAWKYKEEFQRCWNKGTKSFRKFFETLDKMEPRSLERAVKVLGEHLSPLVVKLPGNSVMVHTHASCCETGREAVSHWSDVIKSSEQTAAKPIRTYQLNTDREDLSEDGLIRRWRFGGKDPETRNRTIILLGETGTGKSTLINMMINYMLGVKWEDKVRFEITRDEGERSKTESHTTVITAYEIHGLESLSVPFSLTVIDTPGFGDTDGPEKDKITVQNLYKLFNFTSVIKQIDAVCLVMKASQNRLSPSQKYIFDTILSFFGKNMEKNIMILITFSDWTPPAALNVVYESGVPFSKDVNNEPVHFLFNNLPPQNFAWKYKEEYQTGWNKGTKSFRRFFKTLDKMEPQSVEMAVKVSGERLSPPAVKLPGNSATGERLSPPAVKIPGNSATGERLSPPAVKIPGNSAMTQSHTSCRETGREIMSKWSDVIKSSEQIASEPTETYLLNTDREDLSEDGLIRRWRFGRKDPETRNRTIILLGETGTGKSTLINMMINYMLGVKWEDKVRFEIIRDEDEKSQTESQTSAVTAYEIHGLESLSVPFSLTVIWTAGEDTADLEEGKFTAHILHRSFSSLSVIKQIDAVCLVMKASQNRLSSSQMYIFDTILSLFGKNLEKNIMTLFTFSDWTRPADALEALIESGVPLAKDGNNEPVHFLFNNCPFQGYQKKYEKLYKKNWESVTESMREFFQTLDEMETQSLRMSETILKERGSLEAHIQSLEAVLTDVQKTHEALEEARKTLEEHKEYVKRKNNFEYECEKVVMKKVYLKEPVTVCIKCQEILPSSWFSFKDCSSKCSNKVQTQEIYVGVNEKGTRIDEHQKKAAELKLAEMVSVISILKQEMKTKEAVKTKLIKSCFHSIDHLREHALKFLSYSTYQSIKRLMEILLKSNCTEEAEKLQKMLE